MAYRTAGALLTVAGLAAIAVAILADPEAEGAIAAAGALVAILGLASLALAWLLYPRARDDAELERYGRPAQATVLGVEHRGVSATGEQVARLRLRVRPAGERPFTARREVMLPSAPAEGEVLRVKFDPHRRRRLIVIG